MFGFRHIMLVAMISAASSCADVRIVAATVRMNMPSFDICADIVLVITFYPPVCFCVLVNLWNILSASLYHVKVHSQ
jgi:hypothetical protein